MPAEVTMPQLSDTMTEGTLIKWNKKEGDPIKAGEEIADIETDKATMPLEAKRAAKLVEANRKFFSAARQSGNPASNRRARKPRVRSIATASNERTQ